MKKTVIILTLLCSFTALSAQLTYGVTGLLHAPSAEMQSDKTVMIGGNFLHQEITPPTWNYHTFNYFLNITIFPWMEVAYTCTAFKMNVFGKTGFKNQDRYFSLRLRALEEGQFWQYMPAVVFGTSDPYTESGGGAVSASSGNGYNCRFFVAATKHIALGPETVGVHVSYVFNHRTDYRLNGIAAGLTYNPTFASDLRLIVEYDSRDVAVGATYLLFRHLHAQVEMQRMKYFTGGLTYKVYLK